MIEGTLVKRLLILALIALLAMSTAACTREKPSEPTTPVVAQVVTPIPAATTPAASGAASPTMPAPTAATTVVAAAPDTPTPTLLAPVTATPTPPQTSPPLAPSVPGTYTVQWGDWLNKIAAQLGVTPQAIIAANPGLNPNRIYPGQVLNIPGGGTPAPTSAPGATPTIIPSGPTTYTVQRGEWIYAIARKFGVTVPALLAANPGVNPNFVYPGQVLNIPGNVPPGPTPPTPGPSGTYVVQRGDTLFSIAVRFRTTTYVLQIANHLASPNFIYPGQVLIIPQ